MSAPRKKSRRRSRSPARGGDDLKLGIEQQRDHRKFGRGIGMGQAAADRAAIADREMRDAFHRGGEHREMSGDDGRSLERMVAGERANSNGVSRCPR